MLSISQRQDFEWFVANYNDLFKKYGKSFLVIKNQTVIGIYHSFTDGIEQTLKNELIGTFIVQECDGTTDAYTNYIASTNFMN